MALVTRRVSACNSDCSGLGLHMTLRFTSPQAARVSSSARLTALMADQRLPLRMP